MKTKLLWLVILVVLMASIILTGCGCRTFRSITDQNAFNEGIEYRIDFDDGYFCYADSYEIGEGGILILNGYYRTDDKGDIVLEDRVLIEAGGYRIIELKETAE